MTQGNAAAGRGAKLTSGDILALLMFPFMFFFSFLVLGGSKHIGDSMGPGVPGILVQFGGAALFFGVNFGYTVRLARILAKRRLAAERSYSDDLKTMIEETTSDAVPDGQASKGIFIEGFILGARSVDATLSRDDLTEKALRCLKN